MNRDILSCPNVANRDFLSTRRHPAHPVSALILHPRELQALWSQNYGTGSYVVPGRHQYYNAMLRILLGYDRHNIHTPVTPIH